jgi:hypothetical protein
MTWTDFNTLVAALAAFFAALAKLIWALRRPR